MITSNKSREQMDFCIQNELCNIKAFTISTNLNTKLRSKIQGDKLNQQSTKYRWIDLFIHLSVGFQSLKLREYWNRLPNPAKIYFSITTMDDEITRNNWEAECRIYLRQHNNTAITMITQKIVENSIKKKTRLSMEHTTRECNNRRRSTWKTEN